MCYFFITLACIWGPGEFYPGSYSLMIAPGDSHQCSILIGGLGRCISQSSCGVWGSRGLGGGTIHYMSDGGGPRTSQMNDSVMQVWLGLWTFSWFIAVLCLCCDCFGTHGESVWERPYPYCLLCCVDFLWRNSWDTEQKVYVLLKSRIFALLGNVREGAWVLQYLRTSDVQGWEWNPCFLTLFSGSSILLDK